MGLKRIGPNKWAYDIHVRGLRRLRGVFSGTKTEAQAFYYAEKTKLRANDNRSLTFTTVGEILNVYLIEHYQYTARHKKSPTLFNHVFKGIGHYKLSDFRAINFKSWLEKKKHEEWKKNRLFKPDTLNSFLIFARAAFNWAMTYHDYPKNPLLPIEKLPAENRQLWTYSQKQVDDICREARKTSYGYLFLALKYLPCRISELLTLTGKDILDGYIRIKDERSKTREGRTLPIPEALKDYLGSIPKDCPHVFCTSVQGNLIKRSPLYANNLRRWLLSKVSKFNLPGATLHGFRRTAAVRLYEAGVELPTIQAMTGHSDLKTLVHRYLPVSQRHKIEALDKLEMLFCGKSVDKVDKKYHHVKAA